MEVFYKLLCLYRVIARQCIYVCIYDSHVLVCMSPGCLYCTQVPYVCNYVCVCVSRMYVQYYELAHRWYVRAISHRMFINTHAHRASHSNISRYQVWSWVSKLATRHYIHPSLHSVHTCIHTHGVQQAVRYIYSMHLHISSVGIPTDKIRN